MEAVNNIAKGLSKNQLIGYFLILWAITFFFSAISGFIWLTEGYANAGDFITDIPWNLAELGCAALLVLLGVKILNEEKQPKQPSA